MPRARKHAHELEEIGLQRVRARPGCRGVRSVTLTLDEDGEWAFGAYEPGTADIHAVLAATIAVGHAMHDEFDLVTDT